MNDDQNGSAEVEAPETKRELTKDERMQARRLERKAYSVQDVADMLDVSTDIVYRLVKTGSLPHKRMGGRIIIPIQGFEAWLEQVNDESATGPAKAD